MTDTEFKSSPAESLLSSSVSGTGFDIEFFWDPVCPFAWITSRWVTEVAAQTGYSVDWRLISLRLLNKEKDYSSEFPPEYEHLHTAGLRFLRIASAVRGELGREAMGSLVTAYGQSYWDQPEGSIKISHLSTHHHAVDVLAAAELDASYADALEDSSYDQAIDDETELALTRTRRHVGTPIITFGPPDGLSFFGPIISRVPAAEDAVRLWDAVTTLAAFPGFAELKRSLREQPQLNINGLTNATPVQQAWQGGHRAGHLPGDT